MQEDLLNASMPAVIKPEDASTNEAATKEENRLKEGITGHIFSVSAAMVGVCLTAIGLIRVVISLGHINTLADDLLAADALLFSIACFTSYAALRTTDPVRFRIRERIADTTFLIGMILMVIVCAVITWTLESRSAVPPQQPEHAAAQTLPS